jgi:hypothetical protein
MPSSLAFVLLALMPFALAMLASDSLWEERFSIVAGR